MIGGPRCSGGWFGFNADRIWKPRRRRARHDQLFVGNRGGRVVVMWPNVIKGHPSVLGAISGAVAGLVAVTPAAGYRADGSDRARPRRRRGLPVLRYVVQEPLGYDDSLDVFRRPLIGGIIGALGTGILVNPASAAPAHDYVRRPLRACRVCR